MMLSQALKKEADRIGIEPKLITGGALGGEIKPEEGLTIQSKVTYTWDR